MKQGKLSRVVDEQMRRVSARTTQQIALRCGQYFPMWIACGYPKSGTVWLGKLVSAYLGVPYPQNSALPIAMQAVIHAHWKYDERLPPTAYVYRDGRDVTISKYFHNMRIISEGKNPQAARRFSRIYHRVFGPAFDPSAVRENLPRFIELEMTRPTSVHLPWHEHVRSWLHDGNSNVVSVTYESLVEDAATSLRTLVEKLTHEPADPARVDAAVDLFDFARTSGRKPGHEDRASTMRKGVAGDWRNYFTPQAGEVFDAYAGAELLRLGYVTDRRWFDQLTPTARDDG